jgi:hypothetical protein
VRAARRPGRVLALAVLALAVSAAPARAQVLIGYIFGELLATPTFNLGFEIGVNFATLDGLPGAQRVTKPVFGIFADWRFSEHFHLSSAFLPSAGRGAEGITPLPTGDPDLDAQVAGGSMERNLSYIEFPVLLKWAPKREEGFRVGAGPSFGIVTGANDRYDAVTAAGAPYVLELDIGDEVPGLDLGLSLDVEWRIRMISIAARYTHGLTDLRQEGAADAVHSRTLTGTGRIYLGKGKGVKAGPTAPADTSAAR